MRGMSFVVVAAFTGVLLAGCSENQRASSLRVGDCFDDTAAMLSGEEILRVPSVPCSQPHDNEVFHVTDYSGSSYSIAAIEEFAANVCFGAFGPYVGRSYETSVIDISWFIPTESSWSQGDREVTCIAYHMDLLKLERSVPAARHAIFNPTFWSSDKAREAASRRVVYFGEVLDVGVHVRRPRVRA